LFLHEAIPGFKSLYNRKTNLYLISDTIGLEPMVVGLIHSLGKELGLYTDPYQYFGMLGNEMHRAVQLLTYTVKDGPESKLFNFQ
jgi:uncharacterized protein (DUF885 family)